MDEFNQKQIQVRRGNVILSVPEIDKDSYLAKGYDVLDDFGRVTEESLPNDVPTLQAKFKQLNEENKKLKEQIKELTSKKAPEVVKVEEPEVVAEPAKETKTTRVKRK